MMRTSSFVLLFAIATATASAVRHAQVGRHIKVVELLKAGVLYTYEM